MYETNCLPIGDKSNHVFHSLSLFPLSLSPLVRGILSETCIGCSFHLFIYFSCAPLLTGGVLHLHAQRGKANNPKDEWRRPQGLCPCCSFCWILPVHDSLTSFRSMQWSPPQRGLPWPSHLKWQFFSPITFFSFLAFCTAWSYVLSLCVALLSHYYASAMRAVAVSFLFSILSPVT